MQNLFRGVFFVVLVSCKTVTWRSCEFQFFLLSDGDNQYGRGKWCWGPL